MLAHVVHPGKPGAGVSPMGQNFFCLPQGTILGTCGLEVVLDPFPFVGRPSLARQVVKGRS